MKEQFSLKSIVFSVMGIWLLLAPMLVELYHSVNNSHVTHEICTEQTTHLHQKPIDCSICDFHVSIFTYSFLTLSFDTTTSFYYHASLLTTKLKSQNTFSHFLLRGPPFFV